MVLLKLGYDPKKAHNWKLLPMSYDKEEYNKKKVVVIHKRLWIKTKNIMDIRKKGYDSIILTDGKRRTGKSTLAKSIAYLLDPNLTIDNYVSGLDESVDKIDRAKEESVLIFDEGSLVANSKETMTRKSVQLHQIIDVVGQKRLTLIFCLPTFFDLSRPIATEHSLFLLHVYTDERLNRGRFAYFSTKKKNQLYKIGKKHFNSYGKPKANWTGRFVDFHLPFEEEYIQLKRESLRETFDKSKPKINAFDKSKLLTEYLLNFKKNCPEVTDLVIAKGFGIGKSEYYRRRRAYGSVSGS